MFHHTVLTHEIFGHSVDINGVVSRHSEAAGLLLYMSADKFTVFSGNKIFKVAGDLLDVL